MAEEVIRKYARLDILVNNAGITKDNLILRMTEAEYDRVLDTSISAATSRARSLEPL